ncbi:MAG: hypothetical protein ACI9QN_000676 [Arcticibacterium sp.]|jgi:hypothetical protein
MSVPDGMTVNKNSCLFESCVLFPEPYVLFEVSTVTSLTG